ncbi:hypothetical protein FA15DRAFT_604151, partial [Coprinopsis marcescibilis]
PTRHPRFWFHDGSIVLQVETKLFRVHQTILANHSEVFAGLFDVPQPPVVNGDGGDMVLDGCHIIVLSGDDEKDFEDLLNAVYNPSYFELLRPTATLDEVLDFISGILRLSTKYLIRNLRQRCLALLKLKFPTTFDEYNAKATSRQQSTLGGRASERYKSDSIMRAISLAHETNVLTVLPYAYYCVARMSLRRLMKDGEQRAAKAAREAELGWKLKCVCLVGRERLRWAEMSVSYSFLMLFQRSPECRSGLGGGGCAHTRGPQSEWNLISLAKAPNPLRQYTRWERLGVCGVCVEWSKGVHEDGRREVWERLPSFFELGTWEELERGEGRG